MNLSKIILDRVKKHGRVTVAEITKTTGFSRAYVFRFFQELTESGRLVKVGHANRSHYVLPTDLAIQKAKKNILSFTRTLQNKDLEEDKVFNQIKLETGIFDGLRQNVIHILEYAFTEMLNNAIEHSGSVKIKVAIKRDNQVIRFDIIDWGIGIFEKIIHMRHLGSTEEAIQDLLKGKQTTDPEAHSGEGIFFTRRAADTFSIKSSNRKLFFNNLINDFTIVTIKPIFGTRIIFVTAVDSKKNLAKIFSLYSGESFEFNATEVTIKLYKEGASMFISRSQARRVLYGLEKFKKIILDFDKVKAIGQGFADEVFRVWAENHPNIIIIVQNAGPDVDFMIKRAKVL